METILEIKLVTKKYKHQVALHDVSLSIEKGTVYGLLGPNGAGKSTLLKAITGVIQPTSGEILFDGHIIEGSDRRKIGSIIEQPAIYPNLTAQENLQVIALLLNLDYKKIDEVLAIVGLSHTGKKLVKAFSLGMKQRLGLAMALIHDPKLLILDEPTNGLDPLGIQELRHLIKNLTNKGITIILSSHILSEVHQVADKIGILNQGKLIYEGENNKTAAELEELFLERIEQEVLA